MDVDPVQVATLLLQAGVSEEDAEALLLVHGGDPRHALIILKVPDQPRDGDRLRLPDGETSMDVLASAPAGAIQEPWGELRDRWAIVGTLVPPSRADADVLPRGLRSR